MSASERTSSRVLQILTAAGAAGAAAVYFAAGPERFWANWLLWFLFLLTVSLGALFIVALEHLMNARWSVPMRRVPERISGLLLFSAPLALIALLSLPVLYPWTTAKGLESPLVAGKAGWLNIPFFAIRVVACVGLWILSYRVLVGGSLRQDATGDPRITVRARRFAPAFMIIFAITITLVAFDWVSSLEPEWFSDIFGVYVFGGSFLAGLAATTLAVLHLQDRGRLQGLRFDHLYNLGGLLFAFTVFWSYIGFAQYMLMWYANIPEEVFWYVGRIEGGWLYVSIALAVLHFLIPFFALITRDSKGDPRQLRRVAVLVLVAHALDLYWLIFPALGKAGEALGGPSGQSSGAARSVVFGWPEFAFALLFVGGGLLWVCRELRKGTDMPVGDPFLKEGLEFRL